MSVYLCLLFLLCEKLLFCSVQFSSKILFNPQKEIQYFLSICSEMSCYCCFVVVVLCFSVLQTFENVKRYTGSLQPQLTISIDGAPVQTGLVLSSLGTWVGFSFLTCNQNDTEM